MDADLQKAWVSQAQIDAERGVIECRMCRCRSPIDEVISLWRNGLLVFAICDRCVGMNDVLIRRVDAGIEILGRGKGPLIIRGAL